MQVYDDRVFETSTSSGTGNFTLLGAVAGYVTFSSSFDTNMTFSYAIVAVDSSGTPTGDWEVGWGYLSNSTTLVRDIVRQSSNANALVNFAAATTKNVFCQFPADSAQLAQLPYNIIYGLA